MSWFTVCSSSSLGHPPVAVSIILYSPPLLSQSYRLQNWYCYSFTTQRNLKRKSKDKLALKKTRWIFILSSNCSKNDSAYVLNDICGVINVNETATYQIWPRHIITKLTYCLQQYKYGDLIWLPIRQTLYQIHMSEIDAGSLIMEQWPNISYSNHIYI